MSENEETLWGLKKKNTGKVYESIPFSTLKTWILEARVDPEDLLFDTQAQKWVAAHSVGELQSFFAPGSMGSEIVSSTDMSMPWESKGGEEELEIDFTPMIDMIFLLIIFFAVTTTFVMHEVKNIQVPKSSQTSKYKQEKLSVSVDRDRQIYVGQEKVPLQALKKILAEKVTQTGEQDVVVAADHALEYGFIVSVLDEINGAGIKNVKLKLEKRNR